ncbi:predicted protein [Plenodomus lingam JN3]|uniref:Predicted protein n=1 Tax=Leptosphaeria maculans (strain JN3 / isolate v23.1.3 / race Av1-4-5-6-7-8) TaxID=985895 RepID=E5A4F4_LEPMJ|nr:predicted protein [Plenodomus lingam JN3]CBX98499.1 predicted protein [Plenodomus lingam JN3]
MDAQRPIQSPRQTFDYVKEAALHVSLSLTKSSGGQPVGRIAGVMCTDNHWRRP